MNITPEYIAGFVDGEGYFGLVKKTDSKSLIAKGRGNHFGYYYTPVLKITQVTQNEIVLKEIANLIGYGNYWRGKNSSHTNGRGVTSLEFRGMKRVIPIAKILLPYLIVKRKQAELIIKLEETQVEITDKNRTLVNSKREDIYNQLKILNKRGLAETNR
jgi:hypothetical protein